MRFLISEDIESQQILIKTEEEKLNESETKDIREKVNSANQELSKLKTFFQEQPSLTDIFEKISSVLLPDMYLTSLSYQRNVATGNLEFSLSGFAPDMEMLFEFKNNLPEEFKEVSISDQSWINPDDFQVNFKMENNK